MNSPAARSLLNLQHVHLGGGPQICEPDPPDRFNLFFKADAIKIPCHVIWRKEERIGVAFD